MERNDFSLCHCSSEVSPNNDYEIERPLCTCGAHVVWSRHRFCMLNDEHRLRAFHDVFSKVSELNKWSLN